MGATNGGLNFQANFKDNKAKGKHTFYFENGQIKSEESF